MSIDGGTAVWSGVPEGRTELVVRFRAPLPLRWWRNVDPAAAVRISRPFTGRTERRKPRGNPGAFGTASAVVTTW